jgi:hypothetical protein
MMYMKEDELLTKNAIMKNSRSTYGTTYKYTIMNEHNPYVACSECVIHHDNLSEK